LKNDSKTQRRTTTTFKAPTAAVEKSSGNVFSDIGLPEEAVAKSAIARQLNRAIADRGLTQEEAGRLLGIAQPRVSELSRGRLASFSLEKLLEFARKLGMEVEIRIRPSAEPRLKVTPAA
jgi:predicted XRE-type DNA-binding protein